MKNWDHTTGPNVKEGQCHVPDIICTDPYNKTVYIIDVRIAWTISCTLKTARCVQWCSCVYPTLPLCNRLTVNLRAQYYALAVHY